MKNEIMKITPDILPAVVQPSMRNQIADFCNLSVDNFLSEHTNTITGKLDSLIDEKSIGRSILLAVKMGLSPNPYDKEAYFYSRNVKSGNDMVVRKDCVLHIGYQAYIRIAAENGLTIKAYAIKEDDVLKIENKGTEILISHIPAVFSTKKIVGSIAYAQKDDKIIDYATINKSEIDNVKKSNPAWKKYENEMAKKMAVRRLFKYIKSIKDDRLIDIIRVDNANDEQIFHNKKIEPDKIIRSADENLFATGTKPETETETKPETNGIPDDEIPF